MSYSVCFSDLVPGDLLVLNTNIMHQDDEDDWTSLCFIVVYNTHGTLLMLASNFWRGDTFNSLSEWIRWFEMWKDTFNSQVFRGNTELELV